MSKQLCVVLSCAIASVLAAADATPEPVGVEFSGIVSDVDGAVPGGLSTGEPFMGFLGYDPAAATHRDGSGIEIPGTSVRFVVDVVGTQFENDPAESPIEAWRSVIFVDEDDPEVFGLDPHHPSAIPLLRMLLRGHLRAIETGERYPFSLHLFLMNPDPIPEFIFDGELPPTSSELARFIGDDNPDDLYDANARIFIGTSSGPAQFPSPFPEPCRSDDSEFCVRMQVTEAIPVAFTAIEVDIKPGNHSNSINPINRGVVPVAILGSETFDIANIDVTTLAFGPAKAPPAHKRGGHRKDVDHDGIIDFLSRFRTEASGIAFGDTEACVTGETLAGTPFEGCDSIRTVPEHAIDGGAIGEVGQIPVCGFGFELSLVIPILMGLRNRRGV